MQSRHHQFGTEKRKKRRKEEKRATWVSEVQVNSPRSLKLPVLPSRTGGREEVDNEEEPGSLWEVTSEGAEKGGF